MSQTSEKKTTAHSTTNTAPHTTFTSTTCTEAHNPPVCSARQLDLRAKHRCRPGGSGGSVLVNLQTQCGPGSEAKCVAVCPSRPDLLAVGANDPYVRVYDRRMIRLGSVSGAGGSSSSGVEPTVPDGAVQYFCPGEETISAAANRRTKAGTI